MRHWGDCGGEALGAQLERPVLSPHRGRGIHSTGNRAWMLLCLLASLAGTPDATSWDALPSHSTLPVIQVAEPRAVVVFRDGRLGVSAHAVPWKEVLQELERHTGIQIRVISLLPGTLTQAFEALPLEQGLRRLFRNMNIVFFYAPDPDTETVAAALTQMWLLPKDGGAAARPPPANMQSVSTVPMGGEDNSLQESGARSPHQEESPMAGEEEGEATMPERR